MKPNALQRSAHTRYALTERQTRRIAAGLTESSPRDYQPLVRTPADLAAADARRVLEDRRIAHELAMTDWWGPAR